MQLPKAAAPINRAITELHEDLGLSALDNLDLLDTSREEATIETRGLSGICSRFR